MAITKFVWDELSDNVRLEIDDAGVTTAEYANEPGQFGELISQRRDSVNSFHHFDAQGSTRQLIDESQVESDSYTYSAFGEKVSSSGTTTNPFRYKGAVGYYLDDETNEISARFTVYAPSIGRWLTKPAIGGAINHYVYLQNQPFDFEFPNDLSKWLLQDRERPIPYPPDYPIFNPGCPRCCCCPLEIKFSDISVTPYRNTTLDVWEVRFNFSVDTDLEYKKSDDIHDDCKIEWYECASTGANLGQTAGDWFDVLGAIERGDEGNPDWNWNEKPPCPGKLKRYWRDSPNMFLQENNTVAIKFAIRVRASKGCECEDKVLYFTLKVTMVKPNFNFPERSDFDPDPPKLTPGIDDESDPKPCKKADIPWRE